MGLFQKNNSAVNYKNNIEPVRGDLLFAIDLGTSKLRLCAAQVNEYEEVTVVGYREIPSEGIKRGSVVDMNRLKDALNSLLVGFERDYSVQIRNIIVGVPGTFISSSNQSGSATVKGNTVEPEDQIAANENARSGSPFNENEYVMMHTVIQNYITDCSAEIENPLGQFVRKLDVKVHLVALKRSHEQNICNAFAALKPELASPSFIYSGIAAADAALTSEQKQMGAIFVDIGAGTTDVAVYSQNKLQLTFGLNHGGDAITEDISTRFGLPLSVAEQMKIQCGFATPDAIPVEPEENKQDDLHYKFISGTYGEPDCQSRFSVGFVELSQCINAHIKGIFDQIINKIANSAGNSHVTLGPIALIVLTGGVSLSRGINMIPVFSVNGFPLKIVVANPRAVKTQFLDNVAKDDESCYENNSDKAVTIGLIRNYYHDTKNNAAKKKQETVKDKNWFTSLVEYLKGEF